jgi:RND family efflux transporter MFP subunit
MPQNPLKTPSRRLLLLVGTAALIIAGADATVGIVDRADASRQLVQWTNQTAVPTVQLAKLEHGAAVQSLVLPGNLQPQNKAAIYARVAGYLKSWQHDIGAEVKAGQVLALIDTPDLDQQLAQARANLATAKANERVTAVTAQRWQVLAGSQWVSQQANDEKAGAAAANKAITDAAQANVRQLEAMETFKSIVAPFDGVVTQRNTDVGALVNVGSGNAGQALFEVADLRKLRIYVQVPQAFSAGLTPGLKATFDMPQYPGQQFEATLVTTSRAMDANSRSMLVELQADNPDGKLAQGAYCQVHFQLPVDPNLVRVPATALMPVDQGIQVAVLAGGNKAVLKTVELGRDFGDSVEVTAGLAPSDQVIDSPLETLQSGDAVQLASRTGSAGAQLAGGAPQAGAQTAAAQPASTAN